MSQDSNAATAANFAAHCSGNPKRFKDVHDRLDNVRTYVSALTGKKQTFLEIYGTGNIVDASHGSRRALNVDGLAALDLRTSKPDGSHWNFDSASDRSLVVHLVKTHKPDWVIGSPPCTAFSTLNTGLPFPKMDPADVEEMAQEGAKHLHFISCLLQQTTRRRTQFSV